MRSHWLIGKTALVTGASSGIGRALALELARRGTRLILLARREKELAETRDLVTADSGHIPEILARDLLGDGVVDALVHRFGIGGRVPDVLVNNAGIGLNGRFLATQRERIDRVFELDLEVPVRLARAIGEAMSNRGWGAILNVASMAGLTPTPYHAVYSAAKAAFIAFSEGLHLEMKPRDVAVTCLCPGITDTGFFEAAAYVTRSPMYARPRMDPARVARCGVEGLLARRRLVIPGWQNRLAAIAMKLAPMQLSVRAAAAIMKTD
jgi:uncharacterized protein